MGFPVLRFPQCLPALGFHSPLDILCNNDNKMDKLRTIEPRIGFKFEANGRNYIIEDRLSIFRAVEASKMEFELFDLTAINVKNQLIFAYNDLNGNNKEKTVKFADASVKIHNLVTKIDKNFNFKDLAVLRYCSLYINEEGEDRRTITPEGINQKIEDWQEAGFEITGFFLLVLSVLPSVRKDFNKYMEDISSESKEKESNQSQAKNT